LWPQGHPSSDLPLAVLPTRGVVAAQFSPDGRRLAVAGADRLAQVMNTDGAGSSLVLAGHRGDLTAIAWSADNFTLATASEDETIGLWQDGAARPPRFLRGHRGAVTHLSWSPTGELLASAGADKQVLVWSTDGTHDAPVLAIATAGPVLGLELGRTSNLVLVRSAGATANVAPTLSLLRSEQPAPPDVLYAGPLLDARFSPDGKKVVAVLPDGTLRVWTVDGQAGVDTFRAPGGAPLHDARFSPDGKQLLAAAGPHIVVFDAEQPEQSALVVSPLPERTKPAAPRLELQTLLPLADGKQALAVYPDRVVLTPLQGGAPTVIDTAVVGGSATTVLSPTGGAFVRVDAGGTAWRFSTEPPAEPLATALMHRLWQASRQCIAPENQTRPRGERARPGALTVASALCETLQRCLSTSQDSDPFPACYARLRPRHLGSYE
jgi:dipeptidyl aminopeptidase/acylaminoacyl peptidase